MTKKYALIHMHGKYSNLSIFQKRGGHLHVESFRPTMLLISLEKAHILPTRKRFVDGQK